MTEDNRGEVSDAKKKDADESMQLQVGEDIFQLFLIHKSRVESVFSFHVTTRLQFNTH